VYAECTLSSGVYVLDAAVALAVLQSHAARAYADPTETRKRRHAPADPEYKTCAAAGGYVAIAVQSSPLSVFKAFPKGRFLDVGS
jgi:putative hemolysin